MGGPLPFSMYDFDNDPRWQEYWASTDYAVTSQAQAKARYYQQEVNPNFVASGSPASFGAPVHLVTATNTTSPHVDLPPAASPVSRATAPVVAPNAHGERRGTVPLTTTAPPAGGTSAPGVSATAVPRAAPVASTSTAGKLPQYMQSANAYFFGPAIALSHGLLVLLFVTYLLTMFFYPKISVLAYRNFLLLAAFNHLGKVFERFGPPAVMPYRGAQATVEALKAWLIPVAATTDLQYGIICISLLGTRPLLPAIIPMAVLALFHSSYQLNTHLGSNSLWCSYGLPLHNQLFANLAFAQQANAGAEIATAFLLVVLLFTPSRNILQTFLFWQIIRVRYWSPDCMACHRQAWSIIGQQTQPLFNAAPFLNTPVGYVRQWFLNVGQPVQGAR